MPAEPADAKGLLKSAIRDDGPVVFLEHKLLYSEKGPVPEGEFLIPIGKAKITHEGTDVSIIAASLMAKRAFEAARQLETEGISAEVVDLRTAKPLDDETVIDSVKKTRRVIAVDEGYKTCGFAAEIVTRVMESAFDYLDAPPIRISNPDVNIPCSPALEDSVIPTVRDIKAAVATALG
jgi:pyruvate dehydrogenase E1 component beta subunit